MLWLRDRRCGQAAPLPTSTLNLGRLLTASLPSFCFLVCEMGIGFLRGFSELGSVKVYQ